MSGGIMTRKNYLWLVIAALFHLSNTALPEQCTGDTDKCPEHSICDDGDTNNCVCDEGYKLNDEQNGCVAKGLDDGCSAESECAAVDNAVCGAGDQCTCKDTHKPHGTDGTCVPKALDDGCSADSECAAVDNAVCGTGDQCTCKDTHKPHGTDGTCEPKAVDEFVCTDTGNECKAIGNAECDTEKKKCTCNLGFTMNVNTCVGNNAAASGKGGFALMFCSVIALLMTFS